MCLSWVSLACEPLGPSLSPSPSCFLPSPSSYPSFPSPSPTHCLPPSSFIHPTLYFSISHVPLSPTLSFLSDTVSLCLLSPVPPVPSISSSLLSLPLVFQIGEERATAISLMRKFIAYQFTDTVSQLGDER